MKAVSFLGRSFFVLLISIGFYSCSDNTDKPRDIRLNTALDTISYCIGQDIAQYITSTNQRMDLEGLDLQLVISGIVSTLDGDNIITFGQADEAMTIYFKETLPEIAMKGSLEYLERVERTNSDVRKTDSGLLYEIVKEGNNRRPQAGNVVYLMFEGRKRDGSIYESTYNDYQGEESFPFDHMIEGWKEGLSMIGEGGVIKLWIHPDLAYGTEGNEYLGPNQALYYYIELIAVI